MTRAASSFESRPADWLAADEARTRLLSAAHPLPVEEIPLADAPGRALAGPIVSPCTLPVHDNSAMDGYAVRASDVKGASEERPVRLRVRGVARAGGDAPPPVDRGEAVRIMTGVRVPSGADSVIRVEHTDAESGEPGAVLVRDDGDAGRNVRPAGEDVREGETLLEAGVSLTPGRISLLAALGISRVRVHRRPRVAILSTGDELAPPERTAEIRAGRAVADSNGIFLAAAVAEAGGDPGPPERVADDPDAIRAAVGPALEKDVLITTGGASMGEADLLKRVLAEDGLEVDFWRVRMRPGTPFGFSWLPRRGGGRLPVLGLPGNPASAFVTFQVLVRPYLLTLGGHARPHRPTVRARAAERLSSSPRASVFLRVTLDDSDPPKARLTGPQGSGLVRSLAEADGLAVIPEGTRAVEEGEPVSVILLDRGPGGRATPGYATGSSGPSGPSGAPAETRV